MNRSLIPTCLAAALLSTGVLFTAGCGDSASDNTEPETSSVTTLPEGLFLASAPEGAQTITALKQTAKEGDEVVVHVVVGGRADPIVKGRASAAIVDSGIPNACLTEDDPCETPWDYCCAVPEQVTANLATLQIIDPDGRVIAADLSERIEPLSTLTVRGVVGPRPDNQVLTINATGIYVQPVTQ